MNKPAVGLLVDRVERELRARILQMAAAGKTMLPMERELAREYGVSMNTVRAALKVLKRERVVRSVPGKGTFIVPAADRQRLTLVLSRTITHPFAAGATQTILNMLRERDLPAAISVVEEGRSDWTSLGFSPHDVGGVLALGVGMDAAWLAGLRRDGVPVVILGDFDCAVRHPPLCSQVIPDSRAGSYLATRHLLHSGHRRVLLACWGGELAWGRDLTRGYREALDEAGIPFNPSHVLTPPEVEIDPSAAHYVEALGQLQESVDGMLSGPDAPTAVVHNSAVQHQAQQMMHAYFHDRFDLTSAVALSHVELLEAGYRNSAASWAVAMPYRDLVSVALGLLNDRSKDDRPTLHTVDGYHVWHCTGGRWRLA